MSDGFDNVDGVWEMCSSSGGIDDVDGKPSLTTSVSSDPSEPGLMSPSAGAAGVGPFSGFSTSSVASTSGKFDENEGGTGRYSICVPNILNNSNILLFLSKCIVGMLQ